MAANANPFDVLPPNLFNLLSTLGHTSLQRHYAAILLRLYAQAEFNRRGLTRDIVGYLKTEHTEAEVAAEMAAQESDEAESASITGQKSEHDYAAQDALVAERPCPREEAALRSPTCGPSSPT